MITDPIAGARCDVVAYDWLGEVHPLQRAYAVHDLDPARVLGEELWHFIYVATLCPEGCMQRLIVTPAMYTRDTTLTRQGHGHETAPRTVLNVVGDKS